LREVRRDVFVPPGAQARRRRAADADHERAAVVQGPRERGAEPARDAGHDDALAGERGHRQRPDAAAKISTSTITPSTANAIFQKLFGYSPATAPVTPLITAW
jgi:hypothetical protein